MSNNINIENRKAYFDYFVEETLECGIELRGNEVKSIKAGMCNIKESWVNIVNGELMATGIHITKWDTANNFDVNENRERKILAHKSEIRKLKQMVDRDGYTLIPLKIYVKEGRVKLLLGVCKGKHNYDKRNSIKEKDIKRELQRKYKV